MVGKVRWLFCFCELAFNYERVKNLYFKDFERGIEFLSCESKEMRKTGQFEISQMQVGRWIPLGEFPYGKDYGQT